mmetsp:Transcript_147949/g.368698  ORF Transcript_147949/g.368698 Transcript_147949/m.368698 type:complete len:121 (-) Transcript_147949:343-705(-)
MGEGTKIKVKLMFANTDTCKILEDVAMSTTVRAFKNRILNNEWPSSHELTTDQVQRIRLFVGGKELGGTDPQDGVTLADSKVPLGGEQVVVHVSPCQKSADNASPEKEQVKSSQCFCTLL